MIAKFNLYDFIANLIPGLFFLWCVGLLAELMGYRPPLSFSGGLAETSIMVTVGFVVGLMLQAISEQFVQRRILLPLWGGFQSARWLLPEDTHFSKPYKTQVLVLVARRFEVSTEPEIPVSSTESEILVIRLKKNAELFHLCYRYVDGLSPHPQTFSALFGVFRCLFALFGLLCGLSLLGAVLTLLDRPARAGSFLLLAAIYGFCCWLSYERCKKRSEDFARSVYDLFISGVGKKSSD